MTRSGKIAVLTNFREDVTPPPTAVSRGAIIRQWLAEEKGSTTEEFAKNVIDTGIARDAGGFSLVCGKVGEKLAVISNRTEDSSSVPMICGDLIQTVGLSNAAFTDRSWRKVNEGEELMLRTIREGIVEGINEDQLIERFLDLLSQDTLRRYDGENEGLDTYIKELRNTIFVPAIGRKDSGSEDLKGDEIAAARREEKAEIMSATTLKAQKKLGVSGLYGTQKQTVVLVDHGLNVRFFERTLFDHNSDPIPKGQGDIDIRFKVEP